jgi:hypothetical protein
MVWAELENKRMARLQLEQTTTVAQFKHDTKIKADWYKLKQEAAALERQWLFLRKSLNPSKLATWETLNGC